MKITKIWFDASDDERRKYTFGMGGIHWRNLDEDISFESFEYDDAEPSASFIAGVLGTGIIA